MTYISVNVDVDIDDIFDELDDDDLIKEINKRAKIKKAKREYI